MVAERLGVFRVDRTIRRQLIQMTKTMHEPKMLRGYDRVGWDADTRTLVTPTYGIKYGGDTKEVSLFFRDADTPAALPKCKHVLPIDLVPLLSADLDHELMWAAWCGLVANILAPAFNREPMGMAVVGGKAAMAGRIAGLALGCVRIDIRKHAETYIAIEKRHGWPIMGSMEGDAPKNRLTRAISLKADERNILLRVSPLTGDVVLLNGGWTVLNALKAPDVHAELWERLARVFPAYMNYLLRRKFSEFRRHTHLVDDVAADVTYWLNTEHGLDTSVLVKGVKRLQVPRPGKLGGVACQLLSKLVEQRHMVVIKDGDWSRAPKLVQDATHISVAPEDVNRALIAAGVPPLDRDAMFSHLSSIGTTEIEREGLPLWSLPLNQWTAYAKPTSNLKIFKGA
jgi:hypothetical protein